MRDEDVATRVAALLGNRQIATAESCTAGRVAEVLACVEKASEFLRDGLVAYQDGSSRLRPASVGRWAPMALAA